MLDVVMVKIEGLECGKVEAQPGTKNPESGRVANMQNISHARHQIKTRRCVGRCA